MPKLREITADFWLRNSCIGSVTHRTFVVPKQYQGSAPSDGSSTSKGFAIQQQRREDCDLIIHVEGQNEGGQPPFRIKMRSELPGYAYSGRSFGTLIVPGDDLAKYLDQFYQPYFSQFPMVQTMSKAKFKTALQKWETKFNDGLDQLGKQLWRFLPQSFRDEYFKMYQAGITPRSILIHSDEMIFPWELVVPHETIEGKLVVLEPLGVTHILGRWKPRTLDEADPPEPDGSEFFCRESQVCRAE